MATSVETIEKILMEQLTDPESEIEEEPAQEPAQEPAVEIIYEPSQSLSLDLPQEEISLESIVPLDITTTEQQTTKKPSFCCCF